MLEHSSADCLLMRFLLSGETIQAAAETAYDMVSPGTLSIEPKKIKRFPHHRLAHQPVDLREGVAKAYSVVKEVSAAPGGQAAARLVGRAFCGHTPWGCAWNRCPSKWRCLQEVLTGSPGRVVIWRKGWFLACGASRGTATHTRSRRPDVLGSSAPQYSALLKSTALLANRSS